MPLNSSTLFSGFESFLQNSPERRSDERFGAFTSAARGQLRPSSVLNRDEIHGSSSSSSLATKENKPQAIRLTHNALIPFITRLLGFIFHLNLARRLPAGHGQVDMAENRASSNAPCSVRLVLSIS
ncbi:hypothetical protein ACNKHS_01420 [Shigella flexneri]